MLTHLLQICQRGLVFFDQRTHTTQTCSLDGFASVQTVTVLEHTYIILGKILNKMPCCVQLSKRQFVMILVVQHVDQIRVERMYLVQTRKLIDDSAQFLVDRLLRELHLTHVKLTNTCDLISGMNHLYSLLLLLS